VNKYVLAVALFVFCVFVTGPTWSQDGEKAPTLVAELEKAVELDPQNRDAMVKLGNTFYDQREWNQAEIWYKRALQIDAKDPNVLTDLAVVQRNLGEPELCLKTLSEALDVAPDHWQALYNKAVVLVHDLNQPQEAFDVLTSLEEMRGAFPDIPDLEPLRSAAELDLAPPEAQDGSALEKAAREFVRYQLPAESLEETYHQATQASVVAIENSIQPIIGRAVSDSERSRLTILCNQMIREVLPYSELEDLVYPIVANHLTLEELEAINLFMASPVGQKYVSVSAALMREGQAAGELLGQRLADSEWGEQFGEELRSQFPQWFVEDGQ
jgi:hypothetical protein